MSPDIAQRVIDHFTAHQDELTSIVAIFAILFSLSSLGFGGRNGPALFRVIFLIGFLVYLISQFPVFVQNTPLHDVDMSVFYKLAQKGLAAGAIIFPIGAIIYVFNKYLSAKLMRKIREYAVDALSKKSVRHSASKRDFVLAKMYSDSVIASRKGLLLCMFSLTWAASNYRIEELYFIAFLSLFLFALYPIITLWRVRRGYFATNSSEAAELISFLYNGPDPGDLPPKGRMILPEDEILSDVIRDIFPQPSEVGAR
jgi:hypothetical protein